ncbi:MAG: sodium:solute symporter family protein [Bacteroidales bacterium]|nr:sodium:solute symporter family protein [Bacteroidales bacterium]
MTEIKLILTGYFMLMAGIGLYSWLKVKGLSDYYVSGKRGTWWQVTGSLFATIMGGSAILGTIELSQKAGWAAVWFLSSAAAGLFVLFFMAGKVSRLGHYTLPEMVGLFYGKKAEKTASLMIPLAWLGIVAVQVIAGAKILKGLELMDYTEGVLLCGTVFIFYTLLGGQKSILKTDFIQSLILLAGLTTLFVLRLRSGMSADLPPLHAGAFFNLHFTPVDLFILLITYSVTFVVGPDIYSRIFCARDEKTARRSVLLAALLVIPTAWMLTFLGASVPGAGSAGTTSMILPGISFLPSWALGLLAAALLSAVMSSADTTLLTSAVILTELTTGNLDQKESLKNTRGFILLLGILSMLIALKVTSILNALLMALSFFSGAFILPVAAGIAGWKVNHRLAYAAMISGGSVALTGKIISHFFPGYTGNLLIMAAFALNALFLFFPESLTKKYTRL